MSGEPGWGNGSITLKMMNQNGDFLPGNITKNMGYVCMIKLQLYVNTDIMQISVLTFNFALIPRLTDASVMAVD